MSSAWLHKPAPLFTLKDQQGNMVVLKDLIGKSPIVLIFYPGDDTPGCTAQLCAVRDDYALYQKAGVVVYGVNQAGATSHQDFIDKYQLTIPLLIDADLAVSKKYGALKNMFGHVSIKRSVIVIDRTGVISAVWRGAPTTAEILQAASKK